MLKVDRIDFIDKQERTYSIFKSQIETFPLIGGDPANIVTSKSWNQHGHTVIQSLMETTTTEITFALYVANKSDIEAEAQRKAIIDICHPLNGEITMKVTLNNGSIYNRLIYFTHAPSFLVGLENRNAIWQKVLLEFECQPFWYSDYEITEDFINVSPLFSFPFTMSPTSPVTFGNILPNKVITNNGQVEAPITIQVINACTNPVILNKTTGEFIKFKNLTMYYQDNLLIETAYGKKKVTLNGYNIFDKLDYTSTFFNLAVGDNEIEFSDETQLPTSAKIFLTYRNLYITI